MMVELQKMMATYASSVIFHYFSSGKKLLIYMIVKHLSAKVIYLGVRWPFSPDNQVIENPKMITVDQVNLVIK